MWLLKCVTFTFLLLTLSTLGCCGDWQLRSRFQVSCFILLNWEFLRMRHWVARPRNAWVTDSGRPRMKSINASQLLPFPLDHGILSSSLCSFVSEDAIDGTDTWCVFPITNAFFHETVANLPSKNCRILLFILYNFIYHWRRGNLGFAPSYRSRPDRACLVETA